MKFMEVKLTEENGTNVVDPSETRSNPTYIFYYTLSLIWHPTLTTGTHTQYQTSSLIDTNNIFYNRANE